MLCCKANLMHRTVHQLPASLQAEEETVPHQEEENKLTFVPPTPLLPAYCWDCG